MLSALKISSQRQEEYINLGTEALIEDALKKEGALLANTGALVVKTGKKTGRSPEHKFVVKEETSESKIWWDNNKPISEEAFDKLKNKVLKYLSGIEYYTQDLKVGADPKHSLKVRVITEYAWHSLFARTMFIKPSTEELKNFSPEFTVINVPGLEAIPGQDGTAPGGTFILINFKQKLVLIGGTGYAGETKKSIFSVMNYLMPQKGILSMHCSANIGLDGNAAIFFGLSGTGKTTLSADPARGLIGDDEHCWTDEGIFNIEGGCYAKCIQLSRDAEPLIFDAIRYGAVVENVVMNKQRALDYDDASLTENTRVAYPLDYISNAVLPSVGPQPKDVVFLTCDAYGVLPPISLLSPEQAMYHYLLGYTAKVAGTEIGVTEPTLTFSPCFGAPFLPLHPTEYAKLLGERIKKHNTRCWLVNTGWSGGPFGVGKRMKIAYTRAMVNAALAGKLDNVQYVEDPVFGVKVPTMCPDVPKEVLIARNTWTNKSDYDAKANQLAKEFSKSFGKYAQFVSPEVKAAGPKIKS